MAELGIKLGTVFSAWAIENYKSLILSIEAHITIGSHLNLSYDKIHKISVS